jgi:hypothetical protein
VGEATRRKTFAELETSVEGYFVVHTLVSCWNTDRWVIRVLLLLFASFKYLFQTLLLHELLRHVSHPFSWFSTSERPSKQRLSKGLKEIEKCGIMSKLPFGPQKSRHFSRIAHELNFKAPSLNVN